MACKLTTQIDAHSVLHRLEKVVKSLDGYSDMCMSSHIMSPPQGTLVFTRTLESGERLGAAITQTQNRELIAELAQSHPDPKAALREVIYPVVDAYLAQHTDPLDVISQQYDD